MRYARTESVVLILDQWQIQRAIDPLAAGQRGTTGIVVTVAAVVCDHAMAANRQTGCGEAGLPAHQRDRDRRAAVDHKADLAGGRRDAGDGGGECDTSTRKRGIRRRLYSRLRVGFQIGEAEAGWARGPAAGRRNTIA